MNKYLIILFSALIVVSCSQSNQESNNEQQALKQTIEQKENEISQNLEKFDLKTGNELIELCTEYAKKYPKDTLSAEFLFKAADISISVKRFHNAINLFEKVHNEYPGYSKRPVSLFMVAYVYDEHLKLKGKAADVYREFIKKYPNHDFADDAQFSIENLNKSQEDLIKMFKEKNADI